MASTVAAPEEAATLADLVRDLGNIPLERILLKPAPGTATEKDLVAALEAPRKRICELVDGVLVEKAVATKEGLLAGLIIQAFWNYLDKHDRGVVVPGDSLLRLWRGLVRAPDVSFISWERLPAGELPDEAVAGIVPDLAVEVLSRSNTPAEMRRKLREYFRAGVSLVWLIQPRTQTAQAYTSPMRFQRVGKDGALEGGDLLPGFTLSLPWLFARGKRRRPGR